MIMKFKRSIFVILDFVSDYVNYIHMIVIFYKYKKCIYYYEKKVKTVMVINSTNINKTKESLNSDGHQFHQYQQNKRKFKQ